MIYDLSALLLILSAKSVFMILHFLQSREICSRNKQFTALFTFLRIMIPSMAQRHHSASKFLTNPPMQQKIIN